MGLIRAASSAVRGVLADEWKEFFSCDAMGADELIVKGRKRTTAANRKGSDDVISNGSVVDVNEGQVALIVEDGKIVEFAAEPGRFVWNTSSEPSCFTGGFFKGMLESFKQMGGRIAYGGDPAKVQRVYYVNVKEILDNKFGTASPVSYDDPYYRTVLYIRYYGQFSFRITDPILFYSFVAGNVSDRYTRAALSSTITDEFVTALDSALAQFSLSGIKFSLLPGKQKELSELMQTALDEQWRALRGMEVVSVAIAKVTPDETSRKRIEEYDTNVMHASSDAMAGGLAYAQMQALKKAAENENGAMTGFMGMGMAQTVMGGAAANQTLLDHAAPVQGAASAQQNDTWTCVCGKENTGKFCPECGKARPAPEWRCSCGTINSGKFCSECGRARES